MHSIIPNSSSSHDLNKGISIKKRIANYRFTPFILTVIMLALLFSIAAFIAYQSSDQNDEYIITEVKYSGGLGLGNMVENRSNFTLQIYSSGRVLRSGKEIMKISKRNINTTKKEINLIDYSFIKSNIFTGTCPIEADGEEITYTFYTPQGKEVLSTCVYEIDTTQPPFSTLNNIAQESWSM